MQDSLNFWNFSLVATNTFFFRCVHHCYFLCVFRVHLFFEVAICFTCSLFSEELLKMCYVNFVNDYLGSYDVEWGGWWIQTTAGIAKLLVLMCILGPQLLSSPLWNRVDRQGGWVFTFGLCQGCRLCVWWCGLSLLWRVDAQFLSRGCPSQGSLTWWAPGIVSSFTGTLSLETYLWDCNRSWFSTHWIAWCLWLAHSFLLVAHLNS